MPVTRADALSLLDVVAEKFRSRGLPPHADFLEGVRDDLQSDVPVSSLNESVLQYDLADAQAMFGAELEPDMRAVLDSAVSDIVDFLQLPAPDLNRAPAVRFSAGLPFGTKKIDPEKLLISPRGVIAVKGKTVDGKGKQRVAVLRAPAWAVRDLFPFNARFFVTAGASS